MFISLFFCILPGLLARTLSAWKFDFYTAKDKYNFMNILRYESLTCRILIHLNWLVCFKLLFLSSYKDQSELFLIKVEKKWHKTIPLLLYQLTILRISYTFNQILCPKILHKIQLCLIFGRRILMFRLKDNTICNLVGLKRNKYLNLRRLRVAVHFLTK